MNYKRERSVSEREAREKRERERESMQRNWYCDNFVTIAHRQIIVAVLVSSSLAVIFTHYSLRSVIGESGEV